MHVLTKQEKIDHIIKKAKELEITAYEFWKEGDVSQMTAHNILVGSNKNPRSKTLNAMLDYLENKVLGTALHEPEPDYEKENEIANLVAERVAEKLKPYLDKIELQDLALAKIILEIGVIKEKVTTLND